MALRDTEQADRAEMCRFRWSVLGAWRSEHRDRTSEIPLGLWYLLGWFDDEAQRGSLGRDVGGRQVI
jgi:hypothetical protein